MFGAVGASRGNSKEVKEEMQSVQPALYGFGLWFRNVAEMRALQGGRGGYKTTVSYRPFHIPAVVSSGALSTHSDRSTSRRNIDLYIQAMWSRQRFT